MVYRMIFNQTAYFGRGAIKEIPAVAKQHGFTKAFIVTDPVLLETGTAEKVTKVLDEAGLPYEVFSNVKPNPPVECIKDGVAKFADSGADFLIGLGGGSPQDTCKGIGIITANPEFADVLSLEGVADTKNPSVPIFGVPTTAGTASETTINYVVTDTANKRKFVAVDPHDIPIVAFVDPDLTDSMPRGLKVATGLDALTHAIEGYITPGAWSRRADGLRLLHHRYGLLQRGPRSGARHGSPAGRPSGRGPRCGQRYSAGPGHGIQQGLHR